MIINKNNFINLVAISRFLPFKSITEKNCTFNKEAFKALSKEIRNHTIYYGLLYVALITIILLTKSATLKAFLIVFLIGLVGTSLWAYFGFKTKKLLSDRRAFRREDY